MTLRPGPADSGIVFRRTDLPQIVDIRAHAENVGDTTLGTTLGKGRHGSRPWSICLSAFAGSVSTIDCRAECSGIPIMDGSAVPSCFCCSRRSRNSAAEALHPGEEAPRVEDAASGAVRSVRWLQGQLRDRFTTPSSSAAHRRRRWISRRRPFLKEVSRARTFGSCGTWRRCVRTIWPLGGNSTTPLCSMISGC